MYEAVIHDNREAARVLLGRDRSLAHEEITETGDRALHLAISMKRTELAKYLIELLNSYELELLDRQGYTACCYAAMMGMEDVAQLMFYRNPSLLHIRNFYGTTPLELAVSYGIAGMAKLLLSLSLTRPDAFSREELFGLFLLSVHSKMFDLVRELLERDPSLAGMPGWKTKDDGKMQPDLRSMVQRLWECIRHTLERDRVMELMINPPILHDAAKVGNVELITMITRDYPDLLLHIDNKGYSMFHVAVIYQRENMLELIKQARNIKNYSAISKDESGDNLLHLAGRLQHVKGLDIIAERDVQMQRAFAWFKAVEAIVPPFFLDMRNNDGYTPIELFWMDHRKSLASSESYMKTTAESCMLISTIILTLVFAAAFAPPGGFNQDTGIPLLLKRNWFTCFIIFEALAVFTSTYSIIGFWSIISSNYKKDEFFILPHHLRHAMCALLLSVLCAISAFLSAFFLVFVGERKLLVVSFMLPLYVLLVAGVSYQLFKMLGYLPSRGSPLAFRPVCLRSLLLRQPDNNFRQEIFLDLKVFSSQVVGYNISSSNCTQRILGNFQQQQTQATRVISGGNGLEALTHSLTGTLRNQGNRIPAKIRENNRAL
ncbi:hypothetical protein C2S52_001915 [Perilla frutescens var. hirtella]|nr:hypothetical protein C2S52_001915 [Perilla frutescens var. hirtella]